MNDNLLDWKLQDVVADLYQLDTFSDVIENEVRNGSDDDITTAFADIILSCLSMQSAKIKAIVNTVEELSEKARKNRNDAIPTETLLKVYRGELPESELDKYTPKSDGGIWFDKNGRLFAVTKQKPTYDANGKIDGYDYEFKDIKTGKTRVLAFTEDFWNGFF